MKAARLTDKTRSRSTLETAQKSNSAKPLFPVPTALNTEQENLQEALQNKSSAAQQQYSTASAIKKQPATTSILQAFTEDEYTEIPVTVKSEQLYNGKIIKTDDELNRFAEQQMGITSPMSWSPKFTADQIKNYITNGAIIKYKLNTGKIRREADALSEDKKQFITNNIPGSEIQNLRIMELLKQLEEKDIADYKSKVNMQSDDPNLIEKSLKAYIKNKKIREKATENRNGIKEKLSAGGITNLYKQYIAYIDYNESYKSIPFEKGDPNRNLLYATLSLKKESLEISLQAQGYTIVSFKQLIKDYEAAFRTETLHIVNDRLQKYRHTLFEQKKELLKPALLKNLLAQIKQSNAKSHYEAAQGARQSSINIRGEKLMNFEQKMISDLYDTSNVESAKGNELIESLSAIMPLIRDNGFDKKEFANISTVEGLKKFLENYIRNREDDAVNTLKHLHEDGGLTIYNYAGLLEIAKQEQGIIKGDIFDLIVNRKVKEEDKKHLVNSLVIGVLALALGLLTFGTGTVALLLAAGNFAVGAYLTATEIESYRDELAAYHVNISADEPSAVWIVLSVVGTVIDAAAVAKMSTKLVNAGKNFAKEKDFVKLEQELTEAGLDEAGKEKVVKALEEENSLNLNNEKLLEYNGQYILEDGVPPLSDEIANTFMGRKYRGIKLKEKKILYRSGESGKPLGQFFSEDIPQSVLQNRIDKAILPVWPSGAKSNLNAIFKIEIPAGTHIYMGDVASQGGFYLGGTEQIFISKPWNIEGVKILEAYPLK